MASSGGLGAAFLKELEAEAPSSRKCLERVPESLFGWKPHEKSMTFGYLALLVAEIPLWIQHMVVHPEIDFATFKHYQAKSTEDLIRHFDENLKAAREALGGASDQTLDEPFHLKSGGKLIVTLPRKDNIGPALNHWVHHRGQLTVYLRLNNLPVPSIYGPSADDRWS